MKTNNGYISLNHAMTLIQHGWKFRQDLKQTEFKVAKSENSFDYYKLNKKTATELKIKLNELRTQINITL